MSAPRYVVAHHDDLDAHLVVDQEGPALVAFCPNKGDALHVADALHPMHMGAS